MDSRRWLAAFHQFFVWLLRIVLEEIEQLGYLRAATETASPIGSSGNLDQSCLQQSRGRTILCVGIGIFRSVYRRRVATSHSKWDIGCC